MRTDLAMAPENVIEPYRRHATSEQFHSEFKTDPDLERLPSGKFATNALVMALGVFACNILRFIGQTGMIAPFKPVNHSAKRRRLRTVIQEMIYLAARLISTGRLSSRHGSTRPVRRGFFAKLEYRQGSLRVLRSIVF